VSDEPVVQHSEVADSAAQVHTALRPLTSISVRDVFRDPVQSGDVVVVVAATISKGGGFGLGFGTDRAPEGPVVGGGSGGGAGGEGRPVAVIEITPEGTKVKPVIDFTRIGLAVLTSAFAIWRISRKRR
jgi:uncharacterized spore protein YtfJ